MLLIVIALLLLLVVCVCIDSQLRGGHELLDPKTVTQKGEGGPHDDYSQLRFLFFGTSRTHGARLSNPKFTFPFLPKRHQPCNKCWILALSQPLCSLYAEGHVW